MKVYIGNDGSRSNIKRMFENGYGMMMTNTYRNPERVPYYAIDNGAFGCWKSGRTWDGEAFSNLILRISKELLAPDFIVTPDKVAAGMDSLALSLEWINKLREIWQSGRYFLAVQDGILSNDISEAEYDCFDGLFVGGTLKWKAKTAPHWIKVAHSMRKPCHIGRVGTWERIVWAHNIGADSIDSMSWGKNNSYHHLEDAKIQTILNDKGEK
jgi:hypothetical protein